LHGAYDHPSAILDTSSQPPCLRITGDWTLAHYANLKRESEQLRTQYAADTVADLSS
jgi:phospholipid/cholesterol/gamma-HCH transport system permease protein